MNQPFFDSDWWFTVLLSIGCFIFGLILGAVLL
jgi:hypothetical protein